MIDPLRGETNRRYIATTRSLVNRADLVADQYAPLFFNEVDEAIQRGFAKVEEARKADNERHHLHSEASRWLQRSPGSFSAR